MALAQESDTGSPACSGTKVGKRRARPKQAVWRSAFTFQVGRLPNTAAHLMEAESRTRRSSSQPITSSTH